MFFVFLLVLVPFIAVLYLWPATAKPGRPFALSMIVASTALALFWASAYVGPWAMEYPRGMGAAIDLLARVIASLYLVMACIAQWIRARAVSSGNKDYPHWLVVSLGFFIAPALAIPFF